VGDAASHFYRARLAYKTYRRALSSPFPFTVELKYTPPPQIYPRRCSNTVDDAPRSFAGPRYIRRCLLLFILVTSRIESHSPSIVSPSSSPSPLTGHLGALPNAVNTFLGLAVSHSIFPYPPFLECRSGAPYRQPPDPLSMAPPWGHRLKVLLVSVLYPTEFTRSRASLPCF